MIQCIFGQHLNHTRMVQKDDFEKFSLFIQACMEKSTALKKYQEISEEVYGGALSSLDNILHGK